MPAGGARCILAAGALRRHLRGRTRRRLYRPRLGAAVRRRAACGTNSCWRRHWLRGARLQQRLLANEFGSYAADQTRAP